MTKNRRLDQKWEPPQPVRRELPEPLPGWLMILLGVLFGLAVVAPVMG